MSDNIEKYGKSLIQHGRENNRVYLMKLHRDDYPGIIEKIDHLSEEFGYSKLFAQVPAWAKEGFLSVGYEVEARIPNFYAGEQDAYFLGRFPDSARQVSQCADRIAEVLSVAKNTVVPVDAFSINNEYEFVTLTPEDVNAMAEVFKKVFETYPFPIHDAAYISRTMRGNVLYFGIKDRGELVAISACEMDLETKSVEMTDFATLPSYRGKGIASYLLFRMEPEVKRRGILTAFTIARAISYGMNITFAKNDYTFAGTLVNNTNISGGIESMNIWYKWL